MTRWKRKAAALLVTLASIFGVGAVGIETAGAAEQSLWHRDFWCDTPDYTYQITELAVADGSHYYKRFYVSIYHTQNGVLAHQYAWHSQAPWPVQVESVTKQFLDFRWTCWMTLGVVPGYGYNSVRANRHWYNATQTYGDFQLFTWNHIPSQHGYFYEDSNNLHIVDNPNSFSIRGRS